MSICYTSLRTCIGCQQKDSYAVLLRWIKVDISVIEMMSNEQFDYSQCQVWASKKDRSEISQGVYYLMPHKNFSCNKAIYKDNNCIIDSWHEQYQGKHGDNSMQNLLMVPKIIMPVTSLMPAWRQGRGAWLHYREKCLNLALNRYAFPRALHCSEPMLIDVSQFHKMTINFHNYLKKC